MNLFLKIDNDFILDTTFLHLIYVLGFQFILFTLVVNPGNAQSLWKDMTISAHFAAAHNDKRLPGRSDSYKESIYKRNPESWGTWQYGLSANISVVELGLLSAEIGIGYSLENMTFTRRIDHCYNAPYRGCTLVIVHTNDYNVHSIYFPVSLRMNITPSFIINVGIYPFFDFLKAPGYDNSNMFRWWDFDFYSLEVNPGIQYKWKNYRFGLNYRLWQVKKIDRVLFSDRTIPSAGDRDPILINNYEHYNPVKFWLSLGYRLGGDE